MALPSSRGQLRSAARRHRVLGDATRLAILEALRGGERTMPELARVLGMHRNTIRAHVLRLESEGLVAAAGGSARGRGRPAQRYRLRSVRRDMEGDMFIAGLASLLRRSYGSSAGRVASEEGRRLGERLHANRKPGSGEQAVRHLATQLQRLSFEPVVCRRPGGYRIDLHDCPFWGSTASRDGDIICAFHRGLIGGIMDQPGEPALPITLLPLVRADLCQIEIDSTDTD